MSLIPLNFSITYHQSLGCVGGAGKRFQGHLKGFLFVSRHICTHARTDIHAQRHTVSLGLSLNSAGPGEKGFLFILGLLSSSNSGHLWSLYLLVTLDLLPKWPLGGPMVN